MPQERKTRVPIYVTETELSAIRLSAAHASLSMSEWGRGRLLEGKMNNQQTESNAPRRRTINQQTPGQFLREFMATHDMTLKEVRRFLLRAIEAMDDLEDTADG